jgi:hypothetical protein
VTAIFWIISRSFKKWRQKKIDAKQDYSNDNEYLWACGLYYVSLILTGVMSLFTFMTLGESIRLLINPEYYAIQDLLRMILNRGMP